jgi:hypothetical protein
MTRDRHERLKQTTVLLFAAIIVFCAFEAHAENIDPDGAGCNYAWAENVGWINFNPAQGPGVTVTDTALTGMAWGENIGWINLSPTNGNGGVVNDGAGTLSGYAWAENVGWINFNPANGGVSIGSDGKFTGYAWGENIGWINFSSSQSCVKTAWVQPDTTPDPFSFISQTGVALDTVITSNAITVSGINVPALISVTGGEYSANGGAFTSAAGTVSNGSTVVVRLSSSVNYSTTTAVTLTIGGVSGTFSVTTQLNKPPVALCQNVNAVAGSNCTASASINNGSYDPDGDSITPTQSPAGPYPLGNTSVILTATDSKGASNQCTGTVNVIDKTPPTITSASADPSKLWPPNHKMVNITINYSATDNCGQPACQISSVTCNEPISSSDYAIVDAHHLKLRADRLGSGNGRIYTITITCTDASGNSSDQAVAVTVPHDQGKN